MMITTHKIEEARVHSDFLQQLHCTTGKPILKFPRCKLSNRKFCKLVKNNQYFVLKYVLFENLDAVAELVEEIQWCSDNFKGNFAIKYTIRRTFPSDKVVIAFENEEDKVLFLLRSDLGTDDESW